MFVFISSIFFFFFYNIFISLPIKKIAPEHGDKTSEIVAVVETKNVVFKEISDYCSKRFVGHRFGTNFFDIDTAFEEVEKKSLKRKLSQETDGKETKKRKIGILS